MSTCFISTTLHHINFTFFYFLNCTNCIYKIMNFQTPQLSFEFGLILTILGILYVSSQESDDVGPEVILSKASFYTSHEFFNTSNKTHISYLIPITFKVLEFNCTADYPTVWKFVNPPYSDPRLKDISITKTRTVKNFTDPTSYVFQSTLRLNFKHATSIPQLFCRKTRKNGEVEKMKMTTAINSHLTKSEFQISVNIVRVNGSEVMRRAEVNTTRAGRNPFCNVTLNISLKDKTFACGTVSGERARPQIVHCNNPDECNAVFLKDEHNCGNDTSSKECISTNTTKCLPFFPSTSPGVIICYDHYFYPKHSIARRYLVTQTPHGIHFHLGSDNDFEEETIFLSSKQKNMMFDGQNVTFVCNGTGAYYSHGFQWAIRDSNKTMHYLGTGRETYFQELQIYNVTKIISLNVELLGNSAEIMCFGPRWNLITWVNATMSIEIKRPAKPTILKSYAECSEDNWEPKNISHFVCTAGGSPIPIFKWYLEYDGRKTELRQGFGVTNSNRDFHFVNSSTSGEIAQTKLIMYFKLTSSHNISCVARNYKGTDTKVFSCCSVETISTTWTWTIVALAIVSILLVVVTFGGIYYVRRTKQKLQMLSDAEIEEFKMGNPTSENALLLPYNTDFEIPREQILIENIILGEGQFGTVFLGKLLRNSELGPQQVAIKTYKKTADVGYLKSLLSEIKVMSQVGKHPNLVNLIGACTLNLKKREVFVLIEYCPTGNLLKFLRKSRTSFLDYFNVCTDSKLRQIRMMEKGLTEQEMAIRFTTTQNLLMWAYECANAMEFLASKKVIHSDLAARNVLLTETLHVKVCDFGLAKQLFEYSIYVQKLNCPLPLKWLALESLQDLEFSVQSDIWSYGVTVWEIFSLGQSPYPGIPEWNFQSYTLLQSGYRMEKPEFANENIYKMMLACWNQTPEARPSFTKLKHFFQRELNTIKGSPSVDDGIPSP